MISAAAAVAVPKAAFARPKVRLHSIASGLENPWSLAFLPQGRMLVTERPGRLRVILPDGVTSDPVAGLPEIADEGQGGLLDVALHPHFAATRLVFLSFAEPRGGAMTGTSVARGRLSEDLRQLYDVTVIFRQQPAADTGVQFGARIVFDRTGALFVTLGDRDLRDLVQETDNHIGKIVRITEDGGIPDDNPKIPGWLPELWSIGHRNPQGAALHPETGMLWTVEHGARGGDELNHPEAGKNYGWPIITYGRDYSGEKIGEGTAKAGLEQPAYYWDPSIAPSGLAFYTAHEIPQWTGSVFVGALKGQHVARLTLQGGKVTGEERLFEGEARFRDVRQGPDGLLYLLTDEPAPAGRLLRVSPVA